MGDPGIKGLAWLAGGAALGLYFTFAAVQGDYGLFSRVQSEARAERLTAERDALIAEVARHENLVRRLGDAYLDLDLLDERARTVLGYIGEGEVVLR